MPPAIQLSQSVQFAQSGGDGTRAGPSLAFKLHQVELADAAFGPQVGRQADLGDRLAVQVESQALDAAGAEIPAGDDAIRCEKTERFRHKLDSAMA